MCSFLSFVTKGDGEAYFFKYTQRQELRTTDYRLDSHASICHYYKLDEDLCNKYELNPFTKKLTIDMLNTIDDSDKIDINKIITIFGTTEQLQLEAVRQNGLAIRFIKKPSEQVQLEAVRQNGYAIDYIKKPSKQLQLEAVRQNGFAILYIKKPSEQVQLEAVRQNGFAIQFINDPSEQVQLEAEWILKKLII